MQWLSFVIFPLVGAAVGAITNQVAIRMLFRPYREYRIGRFRVPFTPGVIPSQRATIARNIAETFEDNLLSGDDIHAIITGPEAREALDGQVDRMFSQFGPLGHMLGRFKPTIADRLAAAVERIASDAIAEDGFLNIAQRIEDRINAMDIERLEDLILGFSRKQFRHITLFGGLLGALIGLIQACVNLLVSIAMAG